MDSPRRDLLNDMADHRPILKNNQHMHQPHFGFTPKTGIRSRSIYSSATAASLELEVTR